MRLGALLRSQGRLEEAISIHQTGFRLYPDSARIAYNLGASLAQSRETVQAIQMHKQAIALDPEMHEAHSNLGVCQLLMGDFESGWQEFEWRWKSPQMQGGWANFPVPLWQGEDLGKSILMVWAEQGLGDSIQFVRYMALLRARFPESGLLFWCPKTLIELFEGFAKKYSFTLVPMETVQYPAKVTGMDFHVPLMSLPRIFGTNLSNIPSSVSGYLELESNIIDKWRDRVDGLRRMPNKDGKTMVVGLVWSGHFRGLAAGRRNISLSELEPLLAIDNVIWVSLQFGEWATKQVNNSSWKGQLVDWTSEMADFADTAALASLLDLVITVDTSTAHASAAVGTKVWLMSRFDGCWRWLTEGEGSPWYPTMRIFRQSSPANWEDVVEKIRDSLRAL